ncbi:MAG: hypothetical protein KGZ52_04215 [Xanthomonadaceae bacterium]|jgi:hypothetical protein|nr:hypothetical protein [Xanthomonadaceae bacterium]
MPWLLLAAALACFVLALRLPLGTPAVLGLLLAALGLLLGLALHLLERRRDGATGGTPLLDAAEHQRLLDRALARRQAAEP